MKKVERTEVKESYQIECIYCGHEQTVKPSMMQKYGLNTGCVKCEKCKLTMHHEIIDGKMVASNWETHIEDIRQHQTPPVTTHWKAKGA